MKRIIGFLLLILMVGLVGCSNEKPVEDEPDKTVEEIPEPKELDLIVSVQEYYTSTQIQDYKKVLEMTAEGSELYKENKQLLESNPEPKIDDTEYTIALKQHDIKRIGNEVILTVEEIHGKITKGEETNKVVDSIYTFVWDEDSYKISKYEQK
jgi:hypothetical protein